MDGGAAMAGAGSAGDEAGGAGPVLEQAGPRGGAGEGSQGAALVVGASGSPLAPQERTPKEGPGPPPAPRRRPSAIPPPPRPLRQKRLLEHFGPPPPRDPHRPQEAKRARRASPPAAPERSADERAADGGGGTPDAGLGTPGSPEDDEDEDDEASGQEWTGRLSAYERKRLSNISENAKFFASLKLFETAARLRAVVAKGRPGARKRVKRLKEKNEVACRRSLRLQRVDPLGVSLPEVQPPLEAPTEEHPRLPPGPLPMVLPEDGKKMNVFLSTWVKLSQETPRVAERPPRDLESYKVDLRQMTLQENGVAKVVKSRIHSLAIHPSESRTLVAAGDSWGQIGLWDLDSEPEDAIHAFVPHSRPVSCLYFSPLNPAHLVSLSYDGTVRCGDVTRAVFDETYRDEENSLSSFDFLTVDASTLLVGLWDGGVAVVDQRTPGTAAEISADLNSKTRTVHVHPVNRHYFVAAGATNVDIYDVRHLKASRSKPVLSLMGHTKSVASAYFSPLTGNRVLTTCADDKLRIFGTHCLSTLAPNLTVIRHCNNTGRWLTRFRAVWDPKRDDCFVVGSMSRPREIQAFHASGELVHTFWNEAHLGSVCSINVCHPTRPVLVGGNSSGRLHVFKRQRLPE